MFFLFPEQYLLEDLIKLEEQLGLKYDVEWICFDKHSIQYKYFTENSSLALENIDLNNINLNLQIDNSEFETLDISIKNETVSISKETEHSVPFVRLQDVQDLKQIPVNIKVIELLEMIVKEELNLYFYLINNVLSIETKKEEVTIPLPEKNFDVKTTNGELYRYKQLYNEYDLYKVEVETIL